ncbi:MAG TPA: NAD-dependent epimerase [Candidatus Eisenbergiella merdipullorum]|uniref:NAD-dependent epimerase n=1 Tax=Candidatus Eisenbergiella merdipullorum TaxID=2838553 RepID=A0A9D2KZL4_9FIRM|nr:NAD-dependent epimerase [Candidatus Eisenbergiella merdipullorum]
MRADYREPDRTKKVLVTGAAGFIGFHLADRLLKEGYAVCGIDNLNAYYDVRLKELRLSLLEKYEKFHFDRINMSDKSGIEEIFSDNSPDIVVNLAAQPGVRYSIENPDVYIESNIIGFYNILEACRHSRDVGNHPVEHLVFASSSSVYGNQKKTPFSVTDPVDRPISLYAATKKSNELMAYTYCHLYGIPSTGARFFTVYGPYGRPDMAYFSFSEKIMKGEPIKIFNQGDLYRDFTYVDDIVEGVVRMLNNPPLPNEEGDQYKIYNIGNNKPVKLMDFIETLEEALGKKALKEYYPMQPGDVYQTYADVDDLIRDFDYCPSTEIREGLGRFAEWYKKWKCMEL